MSSLPSGKANPESGPDARQARPLAPQFIPLSELASHQVSARDFLPVLPAAVISLVFNTALVILLLWYNAGQAAGPKRIRTLTPGEETKLDANREPKDFIDLDSPELGGDIKPSPDLLIPGEDAVMTPDPGLVPPTAPDALTGIGAGKEGETQGNDFPGAAGALGNFLDGARIGGLGDTGGGALGDGIGLGGGGGGPLSGGGFGLRNAADKLNLVKKYGGNDESEQAVALALDWLAKHQAPDGRWSLDGYHKHSPGCKCRDAAFEKLVQNNDTAGTALGLLPFLGAGHSHKKDTRYRGTVFKALSYLIGRQDGRGDLGGQMYAHGLATIALCEAYGLTSDPKLRLPAQRAVDFIVFAQQPTAGGWRYTPRPEVGDVSVAGWQVMALKSAQMATLNVPASSLELAKKFLDSCQVNSPDLHGYGYMPKDEVRPTMTAAGLLNRQYLGWGPRNPELLKGCKYLLRNLPPAKPAANAKEKLGDIYYFYYATQVMHHMEGHYWDTWNPLMRDFLIRTQEKEGHKAGSWNPDGSDFGSTGGRIYATSLAALTLEVYYRHLPLYRRGVGREVPVEAAKEPAMPAKP